MTDQATQEVEAPAEQQETPSQPDKQLHIVCAARGGKGSQPAVKRAIELARERNARLTFLFVVDTEFLSHSMMVAPPSVIREQLEDMGEFIMAMLQAQAREAGVIADYAVREGPVREQIRQFVEENDVDVLVMGRPHGETDADLFDEGTVTHFAATLEQETGVDVILVSQEDVLGSERIGTGP